MKLDARAPKGLGLALLFLLAPELAAQAIRGAIYPADPGRPLAGELITVTDDRSRFVAYGSTDVAGEFSIDVQRPGAYRVQWQQREGRASVEERAAVANSALEPVALREVGRSASYRPFAGIAAACRRAGFRDESKFTAAESALRALLSATTSRADDSLTADVVQYDLERMPGDATLRVISVVEGRAAAGAVFDALLPTASGSLEGDWSGKTCPASPASLRADHDPIALSVAPLADSVNTRRAAAVLWIDRRTGAVGGVTPVDDDPRAPPPEARVDLAVLPTGHVVLRRWRLVVPADSSAGERLRGGTLSGVSVRGLPRSEIAVPTVRVMLAESSRALRGASLAILDGGPLADFDSAGRASIAVGVEGDYLVEVAAPELEAAGVAASVSMVRARAAAGEPDVVTLPLLSELRWAACGLAEADPSGVLVRLQMAVPARVPRHTSLRLRPASAAPAGAAGGAALTIPLSSAGRAIWCASRSSGAWMIDAGDGTGSHLVQLPVTAVDTLVILGSAAEVSAAPAVTQRSTLRVNVVDSLGARLPGVSIRLFDSTGVRIDGRVGGDGTAVFGGLDVAATTLEARAVGFAPGSAKVTLDAGENDVTLVLQRNLVVQLDPVYIRELPSLLSRHGEFERRRRYGFAAAIYTAEDILRRNPIDTWQLFQATRSLRLTRDGGGIYAISMRGRILQREGAMGNCVARVVVDGSFLAHPANLEDLPRPAEIHGIEVYAGVATIPIEYRLGASGMCGLILVWTK